MRLNQNTTAKSNRRSLELKTKSFILTTENIILMTGFFTFSGRYETTDKCMRRFIINIFSKSPDKPVRRPHNVSTVFKKLQIAEVRVEQSQRCGSPWKRCEDTAIVWNSMWRRLFRTCSNQTPRLGVCKACKTRCGVF